jgi:hypothetical protein
VRNYRRQGLTSLAVILCCALLIQPVVASVKPIEAHANGQLMASAAMKNKAVNPLISRLK